ncbi:MAG: NUDIX hydrolase [Chloroflexi bacterium]|nr:NUDIX hydrolase [Chloroflexota bacterium]
MFKQSSSQIVHQGKVISVAVERVTYPDGREAYFDIVHHPGAVTMLPLDVQGQLWLVRQYRQGSRGMLLELPAGTLEPGEEPLTCAGRELREEIGQAAGQIELLGECFLAPGYSTERMYFYLATDLVAAALERDENEFMEIERYPLAEVWRMAAAGEIRDAKTLAGLALLAARKDDL